MRLNEKLLVGRLDEISFTAKPPFLTTKGSLPVRRAQALDQRR
jgi:hypothetical protein